MKFPPQLLLLVATVLWGGNFVIGRAVSGDIPPITLAFFRWLVAFFVFFPIAYSRMKKEWAALKKALGGSRVISSNRGCRIQYARLNRVTFTVYELLTTSQAIVWSISTIGAIFYVGVIASIVAFLSWNTGVVALGANKAGLYLNFIPLFATIFAVAFLNEQLLLAQIIGGIAVISGVFISTKK